MTDFRLKKKSIFRIFGNAEKQNTELEILAEILGGFFSKDKKKFADVLASNKQLLKQKISKMFRIFFFGNRTAHKRAAHKRSAPYWCEKATRAYQSFFG